MKQNLCEVTTRDELADFLAISRRSLNYVLYEKKIENYYITFEIPKKNGETRKINAPSGELKAIQKILAEKLWIHQTYIWEKYGIKPNISHGFIKQKGIITNAKIHRNKRFVLNIDLQNFFDSFHFGRVKGFFEKNRDFCLPREVAIVIAQLTCYKGCLPQGAPSSPIITNLICQILDNRLLKWAKKYKLDYTRYADDLTFSTNDKNFVEVKNEFLGHIQREIEKAGFKINEKKTRFLYKDSQQKVTGLVVNQKINVSQTYYRTTRAMAHSLYTKGEFMIGDQPGTIAQLEGRFAFINQITEFNNELDGEKHDFRHLSGREKEFKRFLFYKYFYGSSTPVIVTEGKTDIIYLKAALKALYEDYPHLISKSNNGEYIFKISFLKRTGKKKPGKTNRLEHFLGIVKDGADTMKNIYTCFSGAKGREKTCFEYFLGLGIPQKMPVILLFDNEFDSKHPLGNFLNSNQFSFSKDQINDMKQELYLRPLLNAKLFLLTIPLAPETEKAEIENLFSKETLEHEINGKKFTLKSNFDTEKYYGKNIFSKYVEKNFENIDFSGFKPLLDKIDLIVKEADTLL